MADNSRHIVAASSDQIAKAVGTSINISSAVHAFGGLFYVNSATNVSLLRIGSNSGSTLTRGWELAINNSGKIELRNEAGGGAAGTTTFATGTWYRISVCYTSRFAGSINLNGVAEVSFGGAPDPPAAMQAGDVFSTGLGLSGPGWARSNGRDAWLFFSQGVAGSAAIWDACLQDPQSFVTNYGPTGSVTANALKVLWPMQCANASEVDMSGVGNDGTYTGTTLGTADGPSPSTPWSSVCGVSGQPSNRRFAQTEIGRKGVQFTGIGIGRSGVILSRKVA
jgi:hypothetical protein